MSSSGAAGENVCKRDRDKDESKKSRNGTGMKMDGSSEKDTGYMCWIKKSHDFRRLETECIRQVNHDAPEILFWMNLISGILTNHRDKACYHRWCLTTATKYNHVELVRLILADKNRDHLYSELNFGLYSSCKDDCHYECPLYIAVKQGNLSMVGILLRAGALVGKNSVLEDRHFSLQQQYKIKREHVKIVDDIAWFEYISKHLSAMEYACILNQLEILRLLLSHVHRRNGKRTGWFDYRHKRRFQPLHFIMLMATQCYGPNFGRLPAFVQEAIDAGEDVHAIDEFGLTPLQYLIDRIQIVAPPGEVGTNHRKIIFEIAKVLLKAGSDGNAELRSKARNPLTLLSKLLFSRDMDTYPRSVPAMPFIHVYTLRDNIQFVDCIARLLFLHGADPIRSQFSTQIWKAAARIAEDQKLLATTHEISMESAFPFHEMMSTLGNLFRCADLARANFTKPNRPLNDDWTGLLRHPWFTHWFVQVAEYSSAGPDCSQNLIDTLLNTWSVSNIKRLLNVLKAERDENRPYCGIEDHSREQLSCAIKCIEDVLCVPRSLQYFAGRVINQAMPTETLLCNAIASLGLSPCVESYILRQ